MERKFLDVVAIAVYLDENHIGHPYLEKAITAGFQGTFQVLLSAYYLLRARWVLVSQWGLDSAAADFAVESLAHLRTPEYVEGNGRVVLRAIELSREVSHDVYDCFAVALAEAGDATHLVTTDAGLRRVCEAVGLVHENPVPSDILAKFGISGRNP